MTAPTTDERANLLIKDWESEHQRKLGDAPMASVRWTHDGFRGQGKLVVTGWKYTHTELSLHIEVSSSLNDIQEGTADIVEVYLERTIGTETGLRILTIAVLRPSDEENHAVIEVTYTLDQLMKLVGVKLAENASAAEKFEAIRAKCPEIGVRADWHDAKRKSFHYSGGIGSKQGSGPLRLRPATLVDLAQLESLPCSNWNLAELLSDDRPVFQRFKQLLQKGKEVATSLEVETEFAVDKRVVTHVTKAMQGLLEDPSRWEKLGIRKMSTELKKTTDHYYDVPNCLMLKDGFVLRRRSANDDPNTTWLFAIKGRQVGPVGRRIRLTAQADLNGPVAQRPGALEAFLADTEVDNPVARTMRDALRDQFVPGPLKEYFTIVSDRTRYKMELDDSIMIEFSADISHAVCSGGKQNLFAFEFGLAHPGLSLGPGTASSGGTMSGPSGTTRKSTGVVNAPPVESAYSRTYHVPTDLDQESLFAKPDYIVFQNFVDELLTSVLGLDRGTLKIGGDKGRQAATLLGII